MLLAGVVLALLAVLMVELLVGPEIVELLVGWLVEGVEAQPRFARGMIMMSARGCRASTARWAAATGWTDWPTCRCRS